MPSPPLVGSTGYIYFSKTTHTENLGTEFSFALEADSCPSQMENSLEQRDFVSSLFSQVLCNPFIIPRVRKRGVHFAPQRQVLGIRTGVSSSWILSGSVWSQDIFSKDNFNMENQVLTVERLSEATLCQTNKQTIYWGSTWSLFKS